MVTLTQCSTLNCHRLDVCGRAATILQSYDVIIHSESVQTGILWLWILQISISLFYVVVIEYIWVLLSRSNKLRY